MDFVLELPLQTIQLQFQRQHHTPTEVAFAIGLYEQGLSFRQVSVTLARLGYDVHHVTVWRWIQRFGQQLTGKVWPRILPRTIVVDETVVRTWWGKRWVYVVVRLVALMSNNSSVQH